MNFFKISNSDVNSKHFSVTIRATKDLRVKAFIIKPKELASDGQLRGSFDPTLTPGTRYDCYLVDGQSVSQ